MGQVFHECARTTKVVRRAIQLQQEIVRTLARHFGVSPTTIQKWRKRTTTLDAAMGPKEPRSAALTPEQEAVVLAFRRHTLLPLDDCLYARQPSIDGNEPAKKKFKSYPIGYFHIDIAEVSTEQGKLRLYVGIDHTSKFAFVRLAESAGKMEAA